jgi:hypothetical protein
MTSAMSLEPGTAGCACWHSLLVHFLLFAGLEEADDICDVIGTRHGRLRLLAQPACSLLALRRPRGG